MNRRDFLKRLGLSGLVVGSPTFLPTQALAMGAKAEAEPEHFWITISANGGWDTTLFCDPKDASTGLTHVDRPPLKPSGFDSPIRLNAFSRQIEASKLVGEKTYQYFLDNHAKRTLVINGIDGQTSGHTTGYRSIWSGTLSSGYPSLGAVISGSQGPDLSLSYLSNGGYDETAGLVTRSRSSSDNIEIFNRLADDNAVYHNNALQDEQYFSPDVFNIIKQAKIDRLNRLSDQTSLIMPKTARHIDRFTRTRPSQVVDQPKKSFEALGDWVTSLRTETRPVSFEDYGEDKAISNANRLREQAQLAIASFKAGMTVSANLVVGGYDTHENNDEDSYPRLAALLDGIDYLWEALAFAGIAHKTTVVVGSEMGRTPYYNNDEGKDHWQITSMLVMGDNIGGNRVLGATTNDLRAKLVNPENFDLFEPEEDAGVLMTSAHVQEALRRLATVDTSAPSSLFPLNVDFPLQLFPST